MQDLAQQSSPGHHQRTSRCCSYLISCITDPLRTRALSSKVLASQLLDPEKAMNYTLLVSLVSHCEVKEVRQPL